MSALAFGPGSGVLMSGILATAPLFPLPARACGRILEEDDYDGDDLLAPTRLYLEDVRSLGREAKALAHVTGGGIAGNLSRVLPDGLQAEIDWDAWQRPPVFHWLAQHVEEEELRRVFNLGIGYCAVLADPGGRRVIGEIR